MADFQTSTHRGKWIFSEHELQLGKREAANKRAKKMIAKYGTTRLEVDIDGSLSYPEPLNEQNNDAEHHSLPKPLKCEEEQLMRVFYEQKIQEVCGAFRFPHKIQATAIIYFKRFYLQWSVMEHQPKHIMLTCIYASCKVEENHVSAEELGKGIQQDPQIILNNEMIVLQSLGFDLIVYAPYRSIEGFIEDMKEFFQATYDDQIKYTDLRELAKSEVDRIMLTDAPLLFSPGQIYGKTDFFKPGSSVKNHVTVHIIEEDHVMNLGKIQESQEKERIRKLNAENLHRDSLYGNSKVDGSANVLYCDDEKELLLSFRKEYEERNKQHETEKEINKLVILNCLKSGLLPIFKALKNFMLETVEAYGKIRLGTT